MGIRKINESTLTAIGNAIRSKTGGSALINPEDMATEIGSIQTGGGTSSFTLLETKTLAENVASISFDMTGYYYDEYAIVVNATGTGADYLYFVPNGVANDYVLYKKGNSYNFIAIINDTHNVSIGEYTNDEHLLFGASPNTIVAISQQTLSSFNSLLIKAYRSAGVLNAGGTFKLYGR